MYYGMQFLFYGVNTWYVRVHGVDICVRIGVCIGAYIGVYIGVNICV